MMKKIVLLSVCLFLFGNLIAQDKKVLDHTVYAGWKNIETVVLSDDGRFVIYEVNPLKGDGFLVISNLETATNDTIFRAYNATLLPGNTFMIARIKPEAEKILQMKRDKKKKDEMPVDSLVIYSLTDGGRDYYADVESYQAAEEGSPCLALRKRYIAPEKEKKEDEEVAEEVENETGEEIVKSEEELQSVKEEEELEKKFRKLAGKFKPGDLFIVNPVLQTSVVYENVTTYKVAANGQLTSFVQLKRDSVPGYVVYAFMDKGQELLMASEGEGLPAQLTVDDAGKQLAFIVTADSSRVSGLDLLYWRPGMEQAELLLDSTASGLKKDWGVSRNRGLFFSGDGSLLYFGSAPVLPVLPKDTLLKEEKYALDVWNWKDPVLQPEQLKNAAQDKKKTWLASVIPGEHKAVHLADSTIDRVRMLHKNNGTLLLGIDDDKYIRLFNWEGYRYTDAWLINSRTGERKLVAEKLTSYPSQSSFGKYLYWYNALDSAWFVYDIDAGKVRNLSKAIPYPVYDEDNDEPIEPGPYGLAGWTNDDRFVLIYDRFDIWKLDPSGKTSPVCLTAGKGRKDHLRYRYEPYIRESWYIDLEQPLYLNVFNTEDMSSGFAVLKPGDKKGLTEVLHGPWRYSQMARAKDSERYIFRKQDFSHYPDIWVAGKTFGKAVRISDANPQQKDYLWGDVKLVNWVSYAGDSLKGLLYTPENFDPQASYPMLIYYYDRNSHNRYRYSVPAPSRSIINFAWCASNGYVVFVPDIVYRTGHPGQSAYDAVVSGTEAMLKQFPFIDKDHMGIQGQSWGGYQTAYLVTRTNMYTAAMAGAPVSNMTSAYGGIRWGSGMSRMFQYEHQQSRIGGTLWDKQELYIENSPLFFAPDVQTPLLMMHNDGDGAVPWYQGIEYFTALRRLNKPVWMLVYNGEEHNLERWPNRVDLSIRMMQFFDHYLKGAPEPEWMSTGIPAVRKGEITGYEPE